jgi:hypothetical protein
VRHVRVALICQCGSSNAQSWTSKAVSEYGEPQAKPTTSRLAVLITPAPPPSTGVQIHLYGDTTKCLTPTGPYSNGVPLVL